MSGMDRLTETDREQITNAAHEAHRNWCRGARGQMISEWDSIESWIAVETAAFLAHRRASQAAPAPSDGLREAAERLERACDTIAGLRTREMYLAMVDAGQTNALDELDFARQQVRRHLLAALSASPAQEGGE